MSQPVDPTPTQSSESATDWSAEVDLVLSALEAASVASQDRREQPRLRHRVPAELRLFSDKPGSAPWRLFTRDVSSRGVGLLTRDRLPLGYGGVITLTSPAGQQISINGTLFRCRDIGNGWFEGALHFNREQFVFTPIIGPMG